MSDMVIKTQMPETEDESDLDVLLRDILVKQTAVENLLLKKNLFTAEELAESQLETLNKLAEFLKK